jgi:hypothetical protein
VNLMSERWNLLRPGGFLAGKEPVHCSSDAVIGKAFHECTTWWGCHGIKVMPHSTLEFLVPNIKRGDSHAANQQTREA